MPVNSVAAAKQPSSQTSAPVPAKPPLHVRAMHPQVDRDEWESMRKTLPAQFRAIAQKGITVENVQFTVDGSPLTGITLNHPRSQSPRAPQLVMLPAASRPYETLLAVAAWHAYMGCRVLLYDPRGSGASAGREGCIRDAVKDCEAAIRFVAETSQNIAVWGHCYGAAIGAKALKNLASDPDVHPKIKAYFNIKSFPSISRAAGKYSVVARVLAHQWLRLKHDTNLDTVKALQSTKLADQVIVYSSTADEMFAAPVQLGHQLKGKEGPNNVRYIQGSEAHMSSGYCENADYQEAVRTFVGNTGGRRALVRHDTPRRGARVAPPTRPQ